MSSLADHKILALTIDRPWANLIAEGKKTIETRMWPPHLEHLGRHIAIHASTRWNQQAAEFVGRNLERFRVNEQPREGLCSAGIIAVARLVGWVEHTHWDDQRRELAERPPAVVQMLPGHEYRDPDWRWFTQNRFAWLLREVRPIVPVAVKGKQKLWIMSKPVYDSVRNRYGRAA